MSYSKELAGSFTKTRLRTPDDICDLSGMCATCSDACAGLCEVGLSAVRGSEAAYPYDTASNQFASEKQYPFDYAHFNINGRVFGAIGAAEDMEKTNVFSADTGCEIGYQTKIKLKTPIVLPAMAKLNWRDYYAGAAIAGVIAVIGESAVKMDKALRHDQNGKVTNAPVLKEMAGYFRKYDNGYGDIILQVNADDITLGVPEYALQASGIRTLEIKFGQAAKGIQHVAPVNTYDEALWLKENGYLVMPDPLSEEVKTRISAGKEARFTQYGRLPMWNEQILADLIQRYRGLGAENILFKMAGFDEADIQRVLRIAAENHVALVTFDGAGGGSGHSPCKMMNEWSYPTIDLEKIVYKSMEQLKAEGKWLPAIAMAGGFATEDGIYKALALGAPYVKAIAVGRAAMAAAMSAKNVGELIEKGNIPAGLKRFGTDMDSIFREAKTLKEQYGDDIAPGAVGLYSFIDRLTFGIRLFMALNRKFSLQYIDQRDVIPLTKEAKAYLEELEPCNRNR